MATAWCDDPTTTAIYYGDISTWDTHAVTNMAGLFMDQDTCNPDVSTWDVSAVTDFSQMFFKAAAFNQGPWRATARHAAAPRPCAPPLPRALRASHTPRHHA